MATLFPGQSLAPGQSLKSDNQLYTLILQTDGNVVLYNPRFLPLWSTQTGGAVQPGVFVMQTDGNLVLYDVGWQARWTTGTANNPGAFLRVQNDGNLVIYRSGSQSETAENAVWASGSVEQPGGLNAQAQEILTLHNRYRSEVGLPQLQWSSALSTSAQQWANQLAQTNTFQHSGRGGENLAKGTAGAFSLTQFVDLWGNEKKNFINGIFPNVSSTGNWKDVGHYTQMIWRNTTEVGGGVATGNGSDVLVCHYSPAGNVINQPVL